MLLLVITFTDLSQKGIQIAEVLPDQLPPQFPRNRGPTNYFLVTDGAGQRYVGLTNATPFVLFGPVAPAPVAAVPTTVPVTGVQSPL